MLYTSTYIYCSWLSIICRRVCAPVAPCVRGPAVCRGLTNRDSYRASRSISHRQCAHTHTHTFHFTCKLINMWRAVRPRVRSVAYHNRERAHVARAKQIISSLVQCRRRRRSRLYCAAVRERALRQDKFGDRNEPWCARRSLRYKMLAAWSKCKARRKYIIQSAR